jgi:RNA polymerase sigma-70 factor (ECF subfamily)
MSFPGAGSKEDFLELHRREVQAHCYRMLGSLAAAEDAIDDAMERAEKSAGGLHDPAAARAWLYRVATEICIDPRSEALPRGPIDPCPALLWGAADAGPEARMAARDSVTLWFLTAIRELPAVDRAVLLLRDVVGWSAADVGELLDQSIESVGAALQRARARVPPRSHVHPTEPRVNDLLARCLRGWESRDAAAVGSLLRDDGRLFIVPGPTSVGRHAVERRLSEIFVHLGELRVVRIAIAGGSGFASYARIHGESMFRAHALHVVDVVGDVIVSLHAFVDTALFGRFGLPESCA